jgi:hypothetical protein
MIKQATEFEIIIEYNTEMGDKMSKFIAGADLGIEEIRPDPIIITCSTTTKVDKKYKDDLIKRFKEAKFNGVIIKDVTVSVKKTFKTLK